MDRGQECVSHSRRRWRGRSARPRSRRWAAAALIVTTLVALFALGAPVAVDAAGPRPLFQLPFPCRETWRLGTDTGHADCEIDMNWGPNADSDLGKPLLASFDGTIRVADSDPAGGYGRWVAITHVGGWETRYAHLDGGPLVGTGWGPANVERII